MSAASKSAESFSERVSSSYHQLSLAASHLNLVSDELGKSIAILDAALKWWMACSRTFTSGIKCAGGYRAG